MGSGVAAIGCKEGKTIMDRRAIVNKKKDITK